MTAGEAILLVGAAALGGALNSVAGGGSFFTFPALVFTGIPSIPANATSTLALWPGSVASAAAYRRELAGDRVRLVWFTAASLIGGVVGALILVHTPSRTFDLVVPFLLFLATTLFALAPRLTRWMRTRSPRAAASVPTGAAVQFAIAVYGGYFGGGMGIMMLSAFSLLGMKDIHQMNGLKAVLAVALNAAAVVTFVWAGIIVWSAGLVMIVGAIAGGYLGAALARRVKQQWVRQFIIATGFVLTVVFFVRAYVH